jgi:hypothetical protein
LIRVTNFPLLLLIAFYERQSKKAGTIGFSETIGAIFEKIWDQIPRHIKHLTIFEGLVGSDSDIDVIFEVADLMETENVHDEQPPMQRPRRKSSMATVRPSRSRSPALIPNALPRIRVNSFRTTDHAGQSPLAQLYQAFTVDEEIVEESDEDKNDTLAPSVASHGPLGRPPTSMTQSQRRGVHDPNTSPKQFPVANSHRISPDFLLSASPQSFGNGPAESDRMGRSTTPDFSKSLEDIEKRQQRMEQLLNSIVEKLERSGG